MKRAALLALVLALAAPEAHATSGTAFGESARVAALGTAVVGRPGDAGSIRENPGGLGDVAEPQVMLGASVGRLSIGFARNGEAETERARWLGGFGIAVATPLPGPDWLRRLRVGLALYMPAEYALRVSVDERVDQPKSPIYDGRPDRMSALAALGYELLPQLKLGAGIVMAPTLATPTEVSYDADRADGVEKDVMVRLDRDLEMDVSPFFGVRAQPIEKLGVGLTYRAASVSRAGGNQRTVAGGILADDPIDYYQFWDPAELVLGVAAGPFAGVSASADAGWARWSKFRSGFNREIDAPFEDTLNLRAGLEWQTLPWLAARGGWSLEPSPIPEQTGDENYLGADTHVVALGAGANLRELWPRVPVAVDVFGRMHLRGTQHADKDPTELTDASESLPGQQIDNLGYPGFSSTASFWQIGLSLTLFVGREKSR
ncbi:MAG: hypothetical protein IPM35_18155 [Myxococcales bacterium]|nr:hypothetical protein [Myxococcales bacterium]